MQICKTNLLNCFALSFPKSRTQISQACKLTTFPWDKEYMPRTTPISNTSKKDVSEIIRQSFIEDFKINFSDHIIRVIIIEAHNSSHQLRNYH